MSILLGIAVLTVLPTQARHVWTVRAQGGDFASLEAAIAGAGAGDVLLVRSVAVQSSTILIDKPLTVQSDGVVNLVVPVRISAIPAGKSVVLRGFQLSRPLTLDNNGGLVWIEDCSVQLGSTNPTTTSAILMQDCADVVLSGTTAHGFDGSSLFTTLFPTNGVSVTRSSLHAYDCTFIGGHAASDGTVSQSQDGGNGVQADGPSSFILLSGCTATGGDSDCHSFPPLCLGSAGNGIWNYQNRDVIVLDSTIRAGKASPAGFCSCIGPDEFGTVQHLTGGSLRIHTNAPLREGQSLTYTFDGPANVPVWLAYSLRPNGQYFSQFKGSALLHLPPLTVRFVGTTDGSGALQMTQTVPSILSGPTGVPVFVQPYYSSPIVFGQGSMVLLLDSTL